MLLHNLKLILRNLWTRRLYTTVILLSLTVGFICANVLISFLVFETNTDTFHSKRDQMYQLFSNDPFADKGRIAYVPEYIDDYLTSGYPQVKHICQVAELNGLSVGNGADSFNDWTNLAVDNSFLEVFDYPLAQGNKDLSQGNIVLTKEKALILFGKDDVIGREILLASSDTTLQLVVSAVLDKPIENTHLRFDVLVSKDVLPKKFDGGATYALINEGSSVASLLAKVNQDPQRPGLLGPGQMTYFLSPITESYFSGDNKMAFMRTRNPVFITVAYVVCGLILFIASFNFINLFLLFWENRKKEIGIKKTLGVSRKSLFAFSFAEAAVYIFIGFITSLFTTFLIIPVFNTVFETSLTLGYFLDLKVVASIGVVILLSAVSMVVLSVAKQWRMKPVSLMKKGSSKVSFNRLLFTIQFVISITLAICSVTLIRQMEHIENAPLGFNRHLVQLNAPDRKLSAQLPALKQKISQVAGVNNVAVSTGNPISGNSMIRYELENNEFYTPYLFSGDEDYLRTLDLTLLQGEMPSEKKSGKLVNQTFVDYFNFSNPVGETIPGTEDVIIGVIKDFTCSSFKQEIPPAIISYSPKGQVLLIDYKGNELASLLPKLQLEWKSVYPDHYFNYKVMQEELMKKYKEDTFFYKIIVTFSIVSIVLSCFGLFALSWAVIQSRTKEMGIRKVLGATALDILNLLTITFTKRILIAFVLAAPVGYYLMNEWLSRFANKIEIDLWIFVISGVVVTIIAFATLSIQTIKATLTNPVDEIRTE